MSKGQQTFLFEEESVSSSGKRFPRNTSEQKEDDIRTSIEDIIDQTVGKIFDYMGIQHNLFDRWGEPKRDQKLRDTQVSNLKVT